MSKMKSEEEKIMTWKGFKKFEQFLMPIEELRLDPRNPRLHPERNIEDIARSLDSLGQHRLGVLSKDDWLIVGNGMLMAAQKLGWTHLAVVRSDDEESIARLRSIADNRTQETSEFDLPILKDILQEVDNRELDVEVTGFMKSEIEDLMVSIYAKHDEQMDKYIPKFGTVTIVADDIVKVKGKLDNRFKKDNKYIEVVCPNCAEEFYINEKDIK